MGDTRSSTVAMTAAAVLAVAAATGCSSGNNTTSSSTASSTSAASSTSTAASGTFSAEPPLAAYAPPGDYTGLLIDASDIGPDARTPGPPKIDPDGPGRTGVAQSFIKSDRSRIADAIVVWLDPARAAEFADTTKNEMSKRFPNGDEQPIDVGTNGFTYWRLAGDNEVNRRRITTLFFTEGKASVNLNFVNLPYDPIPPDVALDIARKQDAAIKKGIPS